MRKRAGRRRDEDYVIDLCDELLGETARRQFCFDWLRGDARPGRRGRRLPVDAYWTDHQLVVEYREVQHDQPVAFFDKPDRTTVSGVPRGQQRAIYDARRDTLIPAHQITLVIIKPSQLDSTPRGRLKQADRQRDLETLRGILPVD